MPPLLYPRGRHCRLEPSPWTTPARRRRTTPWPRLPPSAWEPGSPAWPVCSDRQHCAAVSRTRASGRRRRDRRLPRPPRRWKLFRPWPFHRSPLHGSRFHQRPLRRRLSAQRVYPRVPLRSDARVPTNRVGHCAGRRVTGPSRRCERPGRGHLGFHEQLEPGPRRPPATVAARRTPVTLHRPEPQHPAFRPAGSVPGRSPPVAGPTKHRDRAADRAPAPGGHRSIAAARRRDDPVGEQCPRPQWPASVPPLAPSALRRPARPGKPVGTLPESSSRPVRPVGQPATQRRTSPAAAASRAWTAPAWMPPAWTPQAAPARFRRMTVATRRRARPAAPPATEPEQR